MNLNDLPPRIPTSKVCQLAGYSRSLLEVRIKEGKMPRHVDRAKENLFLTEEVLKHLGLKGSIQTENPFEAALD